jgi:hypothetical protein
MTPTCYTKFDYSHARGAGAVDHLMRLTCFAAAWAEANG